MLFIYCMGIRINHVAIRSKIYTDDSPCCHQIEDIHRRLRQPKRVWESWAGYHNDGLTQASAPLNVGMNGQKHLQVTLQDSIRSLIFAWDRIKVYPKLLRWSWTSRGLVTVEEMQEMHPDLSGPDRTALDPKSPCPFKELVPDIPVMVPFLGRNLYNEDWRQHTEAPVNPLSTPHIK